MKQRHNISELRQDIVSGEWVVVAPGRAKRFQRTPLKKKLKPPPKSTCPFEDLQKSGHGVPILALDGNGNEIQSKFIVHGSSFTVPKDWFLQVVPNKFPIVTKGGTLHPHQEGPYTWRKGTGFHEIVIYRDHYKHPAYWTKNEISVMLQAYQLRQNSLGNDPSVEYVLIYHNHGPEAGASIYHPHSQIVALPVIPPDVGGSIWGSAEYYKKNKRCVHCDMISWERKARKRLVYENKEMIVFCPFASRVSYEVRIFPKRHENAFQTIDARQCLYLSDALRNALRKIATALGEPSYNFFIHTAPMQPDAFPHYHWHLEILPRTSIWAGVELGTGIEVVSTAPEEAAKYLRQIR